MTVRTVLTYPDPRLKKKSLPIECVDDEIRTLMDDMVETMIAEDGVGLAAPQIGVHKRVIVVEIDIDGEKKLYHMGNPEILWKDSETADWNEGCLSVPNTNAVVKRPKKIRLRYLDRDNILKEEDFSDFLACAFSHEIDHLDGILYIDRLSPLKRQLTLNKIKKKN